MLTIYFKLVCKFQVTGRHFLVKILANFGWANVMKSSSTQISNLQSMFGTPVKK